MTLQSLCKFKKNVGLPFLDDQKAADERIIEAERVDTFSTYHSSYLSTATSLKFFLKESWAGGGEDGLGHWQTLI